LLWLGLWIGQTQSTMNFTALELARPFLSLGAVLLLFGALALWLSMLLPSRRMAATTAGLSLVASFFITSLGRLNDGLGQAARLSPLNYYQSGEALVGLNGGWLAGPIGVAVLFAGAAWWLFQRRDVRVAGEGSWRLPHWRAAQSKAERAGVGGRNA
jgi:ABC-2 type transport system permease protein